MQKGENKYKGGTAAIWQILVKSEVIPQELRDAVPHARTEYKDFGIVIYHGKVVAWRNLHDHPSSKQTRSGLDIWLMMRNNSREIGIQKTQELLACEDG